MERCVLKFKNWHQQWYDLIFETSNAERMRLASNGNLGLGVAAPLEKLHVAGSFLLDGVIRLGQMADSCCRREKIRVYWSEWYTWCS